MPPCDGAAQVEAGEAGEVVEQGRGRRGREVAAANVVAVKDSACVLVTEYSQTPDNLWDVSLPMLCPLCKKHFFDKFGSRGR